MGTTMIVCSLCLSIIESKGSVYFGPLKALYFRNINRMGLSTNPLIRELMIAINFDCEYNTTLLCRLLCRIGNRKRVEIS